jgi:hypothetical protein
LQRIIVPVATLAIVVVPTAVTVIEPAVSFFVPEPQPAAANPRTARTTSTSHAFITSSDTSRVARLSRRGDGRREGPCLEFERARRAAELAE